MGWVGLGWRVFMAIPETVMYFSLFLLPGLGSAWVAPGAGGREGGGVRFGPVILTRSKSLKAILSLYF